MFNFRRKPATENKPLERNTTLNALRENGRDMDSNRDVFKSFVFLSGMCFVGGEGGLVPLSCARQRLHSCGVVISAMLPRRH